MSRTLLQRVDFVNFRSLTFSTLDSINLLWIEPLLRGLAVIRHFNRNTPILCGPYLVMRNTFENRFEYVIIMFAWDWSGNFSQYFTLKLQQIWFEYFKIQEFQTVDYSELRPEILNRHYNEFGSLLLDRSVGLTNFPHNDVYTHYHSLVRTYISWSFSTITQIIPILNSLSVTKHLKPIPKFFLLSKIARELIFYVYTTK